MEMLTNVVQLSMQEENNVVVEDINKKCIQVIAQGKTLTGVAKGRTSKCMTNTNVAIEEMDHNGSMFDDKELDDKDW
jgi:hypothetical protein